MASQASSNCAGISKGSKGAILFQIWNAVDLQRCPYLRCCVQAEALNQPGVLSGKNLVFTAPTSAGKSAVAEVLMLRRLCDSRTADKVCCSSGQFLQPDNIQIVHFWVKFALFRMHGARTSPHDGS